MPYSRNNWKKVARPITSAATRKNIKPPRPALEKDIQATIVAYLKLKGVYVAVTDSSRVWGKNGGVRKSKVDTSHPDLSCVLPVVIYDKSGARANIGLSLFIEVKTKTGAIKEGQKEMLLRLSSQGALCVLARNVESVVRVVELFLGNHFDTAAYDAEIELLKLNLGDRRASGVRKQIELLNNHSSDKKDKPKNE